MEMFASVIIINGSAGRGYVWQPWRMGKEKIEPSVVLDHFVREPLENAV